MARMANIQMERAVLLWLALLCVSQSLLPLHSLRPPLARCCPSSTSSGTATTTSTAPTALHMAAGEKDTAGASSAASAMVKKAKLKEVAELTSQMAAAGAEHVVNKFLADGTRAFGVAKPLDFYTATYSRFESLAVLPEFNRKSKTGFIIGLPPPEILGGVLRDAGSRGIVISMDKRSGGATVDEFVRFAREQARARIMMPVPIPLVWHDFIVDDLQVNHAAAQGASAVTLYPEFSSSSLAAHVALCQKHGMEPIVMTKSMEDFHAGVAAGARCFCLHTMEESELTAMRAQLPNDKEYLYGARLRPEAEFSVYSEIDATWVLRDSKFNWVWPSPEAVYATGMSDIYPTVLAMRSKSSRQFLSPRQFLMDRRKEGAQEYLGDILY
jgi:indole-3-glycerol phosphate synthase